MKAADYGNIKWIEDLVPHSMWIQEPINYDKHTLWGVSHWGRKHQQFYGFTINQESALDVYSKRRIIAVTDLKIVEWHSYKHLDWITVRRDDDKLYKFKEGNFKRSRQASASESALAEEPIQTSSQMEEPSHPKFDTGADDQPIVQPSQHPEWFSQQQKPPTLDSDWNKTLSAITVRRDDDKLYKFKEGDFKRLRIQDIEDMLLLLVQGKLTNLTVKEWFAFNVSLRMFTRSIMIHRRVEDLQLGVKSYQKKLNLTKPDSYRSDLKRKKAYTAYSNPRGFIYQNKDKKNWLMRIDELHKFSDGTLTDVRTALDDRLKGIRMQYLPQSIWRKSDKDRAATMIHAIDKRLKTRRITRSLERFVEGRLYEGDFRMLQRTI
nr:hypothetical protein [Tanacetum cinerariifolium]